MNLLLIFIALNIVNVILQTVKSIATVKCGKLLAATTNAIAYGLYTIVIIYTVCELPLWQKVLIVASANFIGVFIVKFIEQKARKDKLWKVEMAIPYNPNTKNSIAEILFADSIPYTLLEVSNYYIFNCYCATKKQTEVCQRIAKIFSGKISAYESASLV